VPAGGRKRADETLLLALACGATVEGAARQAGVSERTAHRRLKEPAFQARLQALRDDMLQRAAATLTAASQEAAKTLVKLLQAQTPSAQLGAARAILDGATKLSEFAELRRRIQALEEQQTARQQLPQGQRACERLA
jgi:hypothetical protein